MEKQKLAETMRNVGLAGFIPSSLLFNGMLFGNAAGHLGIAEDYYAAIKKRYMEQHPYAEYADTGELDRYRKYLEENDFEGDEALQTLKEKADEELANYEGPDEGLMTASFAIMLASLAILAVSGKMFSDSSAYRSRTVR